MASSSDSDSGVTIQDLAACMNIIDVCSRRGAFQGVELESVGLLRKKLAKILEAHAPPPESEESTPASSTTVPPASSTDTDPPETPRDAPRKRGKGKAKA